jgi:outer membrane immunogenic protein
MRLFKLGMLAAVSWAALSIGSANAADLAPRYKAPPPLPPPPLYNWTGLYVGVNIGYGWGEARYEAVRTTTGSLSRTEKTDGVIGGVQWGYNFQYGRWLVGIESDIQLSGQDGGETFPGVVAGITVTTDQKLEWFGTSRSRLGYLVTPNLLLYGTAGLAYGKIKENVTITAAGIGGRTDTFKDVKAGWTAGAGIESAFGNGWSAKLEYLYIDLGETQHSFGTVATGPIASETRRFTDNILRAGLNYRLGGP